MMYILALFSNGQSVYQLRTYNLKMNCYVNKVCTSIIMQFLSKKSRPLLNINKINRWNLHQIKYVVRARG